MRHLNRDFMTEAHQVRYKAYTNKPTVLGAFGSNLDHVVNGIYKRIA